MAILWSSFSFKTFSGKILIVPWFCRWYLCQGKLARVSSCSSRLSSVLYGSNYWLFYITYIRWMFLEGIYMCACRSVWKFLHTYIQSLEFHWDLGNHSLHKCFWIIFYNRLLNFMLPHCFSASCLKKKVYVLWFNNYFAWHCY